jgi:hypothetical protein
MLTYLKELCEGGYEVNVQVEGEWFHGRIVLVDMVGIVVESTGVVAVARAIPYTAIRWIYRVGQSK